MHFAKPVRIETFGSIEDLTPDARPLLGSDLFTSLAWWRCVETEAMEAGSVPSYILCLLADRPAAMLALRRSDAGGLSSLTTAYSCLYAPMLAPDLPADAQVTAIAALARVCGRSANTRIEALDDASPTTALLAAAAGSAGLRVLRFGQFGNWHEDVSGLDWPAYLARRPGALRETIRRRVRRAERQADAVLTVIDGADGLEAGLTDYEAVYARSWKEPEPFPRFNGALMRGLAQPGTLRLGIWRVGGQPVAVQFWVVEHGRATVLKLAHDEAFKALSPGTVLTALMIRRFLEQDRVTELDFGRGDDGYKQGWVAQRRQRIGMLLVNPLRPAAWPVLVRHAAGRFAAAAVGERLNRRDRPTPLVHSTSTGR